LRPALTHIALHVADLDAMVAFLADYCQLKQVHARGEAGHRTVWLAEEGRETQFVFVLIEGGPRRDQAPTDYSHLGFALDSKEAVDRVAEQARAAGCLAWPAVADDYPVGYYCGVRDPDGRVVEFSYGQPLGPGAPEPQAAEA